MKFAGAHVHEVAESVAVVRRPPESYAPEKGSEVAAGAIYFLNADFSQVMAIYEALSGRRWIKDAWLPPSEVSFRNQSPLTTTEALQALETLLSLIAAHGWKAATTHSRVILADPRLTQSGFRSRCLQASPTDRFGDRTARASGFNAEAPTPLTVDGAADDKTNAWKLMNTLRKLLARFALLLCLHAPFAFAQPVPVVPERSTPRLTNTVSLKGIFELPDYRAAVVEIRHHLPSPANHYPFVRQMILRKGQKHLDRTLKDAYVEFELLEVEVQHGRVQLSKNGERVTCELESPATEGDGLPPGSSPDVTVRLVKVDSGLILDLYTEQFGTTALIHPEVKLSPVSLAAPIRDRADMSRILGRLVTVQGYEIKPAGKFLLVVPAEMAESAKLATRAPDNHPPEAGAEVPVLGTINMADINLREVLVVYEKLSDRRWIRDDRLPNLLIAFRSQSALTKADALQAFDTIFAWHGLQVVLVDDDAFKVLPIGSR